MGTSLGPTGTWRVKMTCRMLSGVAANELLSAIVGTTSGSSPLRDYAVATGANTGVFTNTLSESLGLYNSGTPAFSSVTYSAVYPNAASVALNCQGWQNSGSTQVASGKAELEAIPQ